MPGTWPRPSSARSRSSRPSICPSIDPSSTPSFTSSRPLPPIRSTPSSPSSSFRAAISLKPLPENPLSGFLYVGVAVIAAAAGEGHARQQAQNRFSDFRRADPLLILLFPQFRPVGQRRRLHVFQRQLDRGNVALEVLRKRQSEGRARLEVHQ